MFIKQFQQKSSELALDDLTRQRSWSEYRDSSIIISGGVNIYPAEIELVLQCFLNGSRAMSESACIGGNDARYAVSDSKQTLQQ